MRIAKLVPALLLTLPMAAQPPDSFTARLQGLEALIARHYRGPALAAARAELEAASAALAARIQAFNLRLEADRTARAQRDPELRAAKADIDALDVRLKVLPTANDEAANRNYTALLQSRNGKVKAYNGLLDQAAADAAASEGRAAAERQVIETERAALDRRQTLFSARVEAFNAFQREGKDLALFSALNRLLAELRQAERAGRAPAAELAKVRGLRRELATWAIARERADPFGLAITEARVGDEPCWFIIDTGAQRVTLPEELAAALGWADRLGPATTLVLAGGQRLQGRELSVPALTVAGQTVAEVAASVVPPAGIGVDGLLGLSWLRRVRWTLDPAGPEPLRLQ